MGGGVVPVLKQNSVCEVAFKSSGAEATLKSEMIIVHFN